LPLQIPHTNTATRPGAEKPGMTIEEGIWLPLQTLQNAAGERCKFVLINRCGADLITFPRDRNTMPE
jgi:hypothetical protein